MIYMAEVDGICDVTDSLGAFAVEDFPHGLPREKVKSHPRWNRILPLPGLTIVPVAKVTAMEIQGIK